MLLITPEVWLSEIARPLSEIARQLACKLHLGKTDTRFGQGHNGLEGTSRQQDGCRSRRHLDRGARAAPPAGRVQSHCRFALFIHSLRYSPSDSVALFLKRHCDRTLGPPQLARDDFAAPARAPRRGPYRPHPIIVYSTMEHS